MKKRVGRPDFEPTDDQKKDVLKYAKTGVPHETISKILGINPRTLTRHFENELELGKAECTATYIGTLYELANKEKIPSAVFFYLKTKEGYRETDRPQGEEKPITLNLKRGETRISKTINDQQKEENGNE